MRLALMMKPALYQVAVALVGLAEPAMALCKYKAADGSWTYGQNCARMTNQEIDQPAHSVIRQNETARKSPPRLERQQLKGYEYSTGRGSDGGMQIRMVDPSKSPADTGSSSQ